MTPRLSIIVHCASGHGYGPGWQTIRRGRHRGRDRATAVALSGCSSVRSCFRSPAALAARLSGNSHAPVDNRGRHDLRRCRDHGRGDSQLLSRGDAGALQSACARAGDERHPRLEPESDLCRHVSHLCGDRHSCAEPMDSHPHAAPGSHDPKWRGRTRGSLSQAALRGGLLPLQGPRPPLALIAGRDCPATGVSSRPEAELRSELVVVAILVVTLTSCATIPTSQDATDAILVLRRYDAWAWAAGIALIWGDLVLPIPQTVVITALGIIYGALLGGVLGSIGLITSGLLGYLLMFTSARRMVQRFVGAKSLNRMESLFERAGAWAIILTRSLPYSIPEAIVLQAGLAGMRIGRFTAALSIGSVPTAFAFAAIGAGWGDQPILALAVSYVLPIFLLPIALYLMRARPS